MMSGRDALHIPAIGLETLGSGARAAAATAEELRFSSNGIIRVCVETWFQVRGDREHRRGRLSTRSPPPLKQRVDWVLVSEAEQRQGRRQKNKISQGSSVDQKIDTRRAEKTGVVFGRGEKTDLVAIFKDRMLACIVKERTGQ